MNPKKIVLLSVFLSSSLRAEIVDLRSRTSCITLIKMFNNNKNLFPINLELERDFPNESFKLFREAWEETFNFEKWEKIVAKGRA